MTRSGAPGAVSCRSDGPGCRLSQAEVLSSIRAPPTETSVAAGSTGFRACALRSTGEPKTRTVSARVEALLIKARRSRLVASYRVSRLELTFGNIERESAGSGSGGPTAVRAGADSRQGPRRFELHGLTTD